MQSLHQFDWSVRDIEFLLWEQFGLQENLLAHTKLSEIGIDKALVDILK